MDKAYYQTKHSLQLEKIADDEPVFLIRAQDISAPAIVQAWIISNPQISDEKRMSAFRTMEAMRTYPKKKRAD